MTFRRVTGAAGVVGVCLLALSYFLTPDVPTLQDASEATAFYEGNHNDLLIQSLAMVIAFMGIGMSIVGYVTRTIPLERDRGEAYSTIGLVGIVSAGVLLLAGSAVGIAASNVVRTADGIADVQGLFVIQNALFYFAGGVAALGLIGLSVAGLRTKNAPSWLCDIGIGAGVLQILAIPAAFVTDSGFYAAVSMVAFMVTMVYFLVLAIEQVWPQEERAAAARSAAPQL